MSFKNGYELEEKFWNYLLPCTYNEKGAGRFLLLQEKDTIKGDKSDISIQDMRWLSQEDKGSVFDFEIVTESDHVLVDVVGIYAFRSGFRLITGKKDWWYHLAYVKMRNDKAKHEGNHYHDIVGYLGWSPFNAGEDWYFLKVTDKLPAADILMTKDRLKACIDIYNLLGGGYFDITQNDYYIQEENTEFLQKYERIIGRPFPRERLV